MTNSIFMLLNYCVDRGLNVKSILGGGVLSIYDPKTDHFLEVKADIDAKVTIERIENWLDETRGEMWND